MNLAVVDAPLVGQLAQGGGSTISLSWRRDTLHDLKKNKKTQKNLVTIHLSHNTGGSYISAQTAQPMCRWLGSQGARPWFAFKMNLNKSCLQIPTAL